MLPLRRFGDGPPLLALHGFTCTGQQFELLASLTGRTVIAPDLPGHGGATHATTTWPAVVDEVATLIAAHEGPVLGYSQGARLALGAVVAESATPAALILMSGTAGIRDDRERSDRFDRDVALAQSILDDGIDAFLQRWTTTGLTDTTGLDDDTRVADMAMRGENSAEGLASAVIGYGQGAMEPAWDRLGSVTCPTLLLTGAEDTAYTAIAHELAPAMGDARVVTIADAGHNPLLDQPGETARTISAFLDDLG